MGAAAFSWNAPENAVAESKRAVPSPDIVDTHQHLWGYSARPQFPLLWGPRQLQPPWLDGAPQKLRRTFTAGDYADAMRGWAVRALYMEVDVAEEDLDREVEAIRKVCAGKNAQTLAGVMGGRPDSPLFGDYLRRHREWSGFKGVRRVLHSSQAPRGFCLGKDFLNGVRTLGQMGLIFDLCMRPGELGDAARLADECPDTTLVLDHCGNGDAKAFLKNPPAAPAHTAAEWQRSIESLARRQNVVCKISGVIESLPGGWSTDMLAPVVDHCLDAFGPERVVFGSNWPVCLLGGTADQWIQALTALLAKRPEAERRRLWSQNAARIYNLSR